MGINEEKSPVFIHSLFRSGSTYIYYALKRTGHFHVYHEPFHEIMADLPTTWDQLASRESQLKATLRHGFLDSGYFDEYAHLLPVLAEKFQPDLSYRYFFLGENEEASVLQSYIDALIEGSTAQPVLQCTRTVGRIAWLSRHYGSRQLFLLRNPWDQWYSYKVDAYISATPEIIYAQPGLPQELQDVWTALSYSPAAGSPVLAANPYSFRLSTAPSVAYGLFFGIWLYAFLEAREHCQHILDMDAISGLQTSRLAAERTLSDLGPATVDLSDCRLHRTIFKSNEQEFYSTIEEQILQVFAGHRSSEALTEASEYLKRGCAESFSGAGDPEQAFEDSSRLRKMLIASGNETAQVVGQLSQAHVAVSAELETKVAQLAEKTEVLQNTTAQLESTVTEMEVMFGSRAWTLARFTQQVGERIAPPGSARGRALNKLVTATLSPAERFWAGRRRRQDTALLSSSELFDAAWYLEHNPDIAKAVADPIAHYLATGALEGRDPGPNFSSSWYLAEHPDVRAAHLNPLVHYLKYGRAYGFRSYPPPSRYAAPLAPATATMAPADGTAFFTICSRNFTAYARTLFDSVHKFHPTAKTYVFLCDQTDAEFEAEHFPFEIVHLEQLGIPDLEAMSERYNITEFNTAIKPYAFTYLFQELGKKQVIYLDPDILLVSPLEEVLQAFQAGAECVLTPHILEPAENVEMSDARFLQFGINNLGFLALRNTAEVRRIVKWWERQLEYGCIINLPEGLFVDQKWADLFPAFLEHTRFSRHPGYNVGYWNLPQRKVEYIGGQWYSNRRPLRFVHFSGNKLDEPYFFSSHSGTVTSNTIGDLRSLLKQYRESLYANGQAKYSRIPYAFSWNGAAGVNLHTPEPDFSESETVAKPQLSASPMETGRFGVVRKLRSRWTTAQAAAIRSGGWAALAAKSLGLLREQGLHGLRTRIQRVSHEIQLAQSAGTGATQRMQGWQRRDGWTPQVLIVDAATPRPDRDAGSLSTFNLFKFYLDLGYDVTFIPSDLTYLGEYTEAIRALGVRCLHASDISSLPEHLKREGKDYSFVVLCRAPIAARYIGDVRKYAPSAKVLFDTIDLHYLREQRFAELDPSPEKLEAVRRSKELELGVIRKSDVTIVLSAVEKEILDKETPGSDVRLIPLIFAENPPDCPPFEGRRDFLFVGGFPHTPNIDAVLYFANEIFPLIRQALPDVHFHIVGNAPPQEVQDLGQREGITVHGYVKDIAPIFNHCKLSVVPLRYGAGIKGKIATSLAHGVPVIATSVAVEGMEVEPGKEVLVADDAPGFAAVFVEAYQSKDLWTRLSENGRQQALRAYSPLSGYRRISALMNDIDPHHKKLDLYTLRSIQEYDALRRLAADEISERANLELSLIQHGRQSFAIDGFCAVCGQESSFNTSFMYSYQNTPDGNPIPNWREHLVCARCGFVNRLRASMHGFYHWLRPRDSAAIYITEQSTPLYRWLKQRHLNLVGSEYFGGAVPFGTEKDGLRNEDLTALTFPDDSFDYVLSFDVMEHVGDDMAAFKEIYRCLKPGGTLLFTAPFTKDRTEKQVRARLCPDGTIEHILPPEYHGNPVDQEHGSLCFRYFAWDVLDDLRSVGFEDPRAITYWSRDFVYFGVEQFIFMARKPL